MHVRHAGHHCAVVFAPAGRTGSQNVAAGEPPLVEAAWHEDCYAVLFSYACCEHESIRGQTPSDCEAILTVTHINFRKAGANYSPLQQNHPSRSIKCRSNPLEKTTQSNSSHSPASTR
ncbi:hypothetical protein LJR034_004937 [Caballeronia sp. LjRoot34]|uniref:hypothetical protein n=1 Tax=Caballeronia sp. LjRoot34 TaxID=3342325 RepID=UPI003ECE5939